MNWHDITVLLVAGGPMIVFLATVTVVWFAIMLSLV
jgi:hypothetical protein